MPVSVYVCVFVCVRILLLYACNCCKTWPAFEEIERETERRQDVGLGQGLLERNATEVEQKDLRKIYKKLGSGFFVQH